MLVTEHAMLCQPQAATTAAAQKILPPAEAATQAVAAPKTPAADLLPPSAAVAVDQVH